MINLHCLIELNQLTIETVSLERDRIQQIKEKLANLFGASAFNFLGTFVDRRTSCK